MTDQPQSSPVGETSVSPFDELMRGEPSAAFTTAFRGYDKAEVDAAIADLNARAAVYADELTQVKDRYRRAAATAKAHARKAEQLDGELAVMTAKAANAEQKVQSLSDELAGAGGETESRQRFEEILHVAEEQASLLIKNASVQADRLLEAAREEVRQRRAEAQTEADAVASRAEQDARQARLRIETETTAHEAQLEREAAHAAEKVAQAEQEAAAIRSEAEKGAAALRAMTARETEHARAEAEDAVRELRVRALEFEESLRRRQDDAQQEFLVLHNQAVAHAERITQDANEQVAASLDHAQRITAKSDDFDRLMRAQAAQVEADAAARSRETLERARAKAQRIIDTVTAHSQAVLRDAEDRTRQLRWQEHQLTSFMSEVRELLRPEGVEVGEGAGEAPRVEAALEDASVEPEPVDPAEPAAAESAEAPSAEASSA